MLSLSSVRESPIQATRLGGVCSVADKGTMFKALTKVTDFVHDNYCEVNAEGEENKLRAAFPFLFQDKEKVSGSLFVSLRVCLDAATTWIHVPEVRVEIFSHRSHNCGSEHTPPASVVGLQVAFAFQGRRDSAYLTDRRIIMRDVTGITGSSIKYKSIPYSIIKAWAVSTAGGGFDSDSELQVRKTEFLRSPVFLGQ